MRSRVVVIGGGLVGSLVALRLADAGAEVVVLEKAVPGAEASSAAAGILAAQSEAAGPGALFDLAIESRALHARLADEIFARTGLAVGFRRCGVVEVAGDASHAEALGARFLWQREHGHRVETLDARDLRALEPSLAGDFTYGVHLPDDGMVDPRPLVEGASQAAARAGVCFRNGVTVRRVHVVGGRARGVETDGALVEADFVVVCAGAWSGLVDGALRDPSMVRPARGQIVEMETRPVPTRCVVYAHDGYLVPRADGHVLVGSTLEFVGYRRGVTARGLARLLHIATATVPSLADAVVSRMWSNFRPYTPDGAPLVGLGGADGLLVATGHYRSGILLAPVTAEIVAEVVTTGRSTRDLAALAPLRDAHRDVDVVDGPVTGAEG